MRTLRGQPAAFRGHFFSWRVLLHTGTSSSETKIGGRSDIALTIFPSHWRSLDFFNLCRLGLAGVFAVLSLITRPEWFFEQSDRETFRIAAFAYVVAASLFVLAIRLRWPGFKTQLSLHIFSDIVLLTALANVSGGISSGLGLLLLVSLASAGLVGQGLMALLYAAMASIAMLGIHFIRVLQWQALPQEYLQTALLCLSYFAVVSLAHVLTRRALASERISAEKARELALVNRIHALATADSSDGILAVDEKGRIVHCNAQAETLLAQARMTAGTRTSQAPHWLNEQITLWKHQAGSASVMLPDTQIRARFLSLDSDTTQGALHDQTLVLLEDPARAQALAQQLKLAALGRLTLNVAHEIRNPLSAIHHASQLLEEDNSSPSARKLTSIIRNNVERLERMVQDMLTLNQRDRQQQETFELNAFVTTWLEEWRQAEEIPESAIIVNMPKQASIRFSPRHLSQILWNLASNAWRYCSKTQGAVRLSIDMDTDAARLSICDDGAGIPAQSQPLLFEPFHTTDPKGTGLGLYIARELAQANQAVLTFSGNQPGACFQLLIPLQTLPQQ